MQEEFDTDSHSTTIATVMCIIRSTTAPYSTVYSRHHFLALLSGSYCTVSNGLDPPRLPLPPSVPVIQRSRTVDVSILLLLSILRGVWEIAIRMLRHDYSTI